MKKRIVYSFLCCLLLINIYSEKIYADEIDRTIVELQKCVDGDTAHFKIGNNVVKARFLAVDTPETYKEVQPYGKEASAFTCNQLESADTIEIAYDDKSTKQDKYQRELVWVYVDGVLLQSKIIERGLGEVAYIYDNYTHVDELQSIEKLAKEQRVGKWSGEEPRNIENTILKAVIVFAFLFVGMSKKTRKALIKKFKQLK